MPKTTTMTVEQAQAALNAAQAVVDADRARIRAERDAADARAHQALRQWSEEENANTRARRQEVDTAREAFVAALRRGEHAIGEWIRFHALMLATSTRQGAVQEAWRATHDDGSRALPGANFDGSGMSRATYAEDVDAALKDIARAEAGRLLAEFEAERDRRTDLARWSEAT